MVSGFELRETEEADAPALNNLYLHLTGIQRSHQQWSWEWRRGPFGPAPSWVIVETGTCQIVAHHGVVPIRLRMPDGTTVKAGRTENTMVAPSVRKRLNYLAYEARLLKQLSHDFDAVFTTTGKGAPGKIRQRFGYRPVGIWRAAPVLTHPLYRPAMLVPSGISGLLPRRKGVSGWQAESVGDLERVATVCNRVGSPAITVDRSAAFLKWRFVDHPYHRYQIALLRRDGEDIGYAAWKYRQRGGAVDAIVDDIVLADNEAISVEAALRALFALLPRQPCRFVLRSLDHGGPLADFIASAGPTPVQGEETKLLVHWSDGRDIADWNVSPILTQGI